MESVQCYSLKEFLETIPPGKHTDVISLFEEQGLNLIIRYPDIQLHCDNEHCNGVRFFESTSSTTFYRPSRYENEFVNYVCRNCNSTSKMFALGLYLYAFNTQSKLSLVKFGEVPGFGPPTPARLVTLLGKEKEYFFKGRRSESQGMGIAAFAYYRRIIEAQRNKIFDEVIRVSKTLQASADLIRELERAKVETQFSKAVEQIKLGIPQALLINGHNPLTLLHSALSEGLHAQSDEECLEIATSIRVVLTELTERLAQALKSDATLNAAVSKLLSAKSSTTGSQKAGEANDDNEK